MSLAAHLAEGLRSLGLSVGAETQEQLLRYIGLLQKWNKIYNLTAIRDPDEMVSHHLLDSLAILPALGAWLQKSALAGRRSGFRDACVTPGTGCSAVSVKQVAEINPLRLCDVGSGAGLPGLVLAMVMPDWQVTSVDTVDKKAAFQRQACIELGIANVKVISGRVEALPAAEFDLVISRAFSDLPDFVRLAGHLVAPEGCLLAMKGVVPADEISGLPEFWQVDDVLPLSVPGLGAQRHLIVLKKV